MAEGMPAEVSDGDFAQEVIKSDIPVLVDFWAPWCGPCKMVAPIVEELAKEFSGRVKFAKINVDENPVTPPAYGIRAIPTLILFKGGEVVEKIVGLLPKDQLKAKLEKVV